MIKILHYVGAMNRAGAETFIMNMFRALNKENYAFDFLCSSRKPGDYDEEIKTIGGVLYYIDLSQKNGVVRHLENYKTIKKECKKYINKYDVFHIHTYHAFDSYVVAKAAVDAGFKRVFVHSHSASVEFHKNLHAMFRPMLSRLPITELACSDAAGKWLFSNNKYKVIGNGINVNLYRFDSGIREDYRRKMGLDNKFVIGHVGRFEEVKNQKFLLDVMQGVIHSCPNACLLLIGDGALKQEVEGEAKEVGLSEYVEFLGIRNDIGKLLQAIDVFVLPSLFEGVPFSVIEAETAGLPCILSENVPGDLDFAQNIYHESIDDVDAWVQRLIEIYKKDVERTECYKDIVNHGYDIKENCESLMEVYGKR